MRRFSCLLLLLGLSPWGWSQKSAPAASANSFFPLDRIRPGMVGYGLTVFSGNHRSRFQVRILGVVRNMGPRQAVIWAKLSGGPLAQTGVIEGMSGSPVYLDGKLAGAVALGYPFAKAAIAGITPIEQMLHQAHRARRRHASARATVNRGLLASLLTPASPLDANASSPALSNPSLPRPTTTLMLAGFSADVMQQLLPQFRALHLTPMLGGSSAGGELAPVPAAEAHLQPGQMISVQLMRGDLGVSADCTVTYIQKGQVFACGHRFLSAGATAFPFSQANVIALMPGYMSSFKIDVPGAPLGVIRQDRSQGIYGQLGGRAAMIPIAITVHSQDGEQRQFHFEVVNHPFLTPLLANMGVLATLSATQRALGPSTISVSGDIRLANSPPVRIENLYSGDLNVPAQAALAVAAPLVELYGSQLPDVRLEGVNLDVRSTNRLQTAQLVQVWSDRQVVHPGSRLQLLATLRLSGGKQRRLPIHLRLPYSVAPGPLRIVVGGGVGISALRGLLAGSDSPRSLAQLVRHLNRLHRNNRIYARVLLPGASYRLQGEEFPLAPPSLTRILTAPDAIGGDLHSQPMSILLRYHSRPLPYAVSGSQVVAVTIKD